jgi:ABC-2 type transport system ATP-binding protein
VSDPAPLIVAEKLTKRFPPVRKGLGGWRTMLEQVRGLKPTVTALEDVTLEVRPGEIFGLLGPNGAGKTTFCKILNALVIPTAGTLSVWGLDTVRHHHALAREMVTIFGGESDLFGLFAARLSSERNLEFIGDLWGLPREVTHRRIRESLELLDLLDKREEWYQKLSGGTKQKLFLATPLILRRPLTVLDEPTIRLDVPTRRKIHDVLKNVLNRQFGTTILLTTHDLAEAERLCDRVAILNHGRLALIDTPQGLRRRSSRGPLLRLRMKLDPAAGRDEALLHQALAKVQTPLTLEADLESDRMRQDGLCGYLIRLPRLDQGQDSLLPKLLAALGDRGLFPEHLVMEEPSLEDTFVEILGADAVAHPEPAAAEEGAA